jgi:CheY-like chemotaxis protein
VSVESRLGEGSTFRLTLPAMRGASDDPLDGSGEIIDRLCGLRVLVVDDNMINRELARAILEPAGVEVSEAQGGREAVEIAQSLPFDVILMDLRMPDMDGRTAVRAIRSEPGPNQHMPILAFSADGMVDCSAAENAGFQGVVRKPISPADLLQALIRATIEDPMLDEGASYAAAS